MINRDELLKSMVTKELYEVHMVPGSPLMVRDEMGALKALDNNILSPNDTKTFVGELLNQEQRVEFVEKNELEFALSVPCVSRYRFSVSMQRNSISAILRTYPTKIPTFEELNLHKSIKEIVDTVQKGLIILTGPKGGGKAHTLAAILDYYLSKRACKILTIENPIRFLLKNKTGIICQREMGIDIKSRALAFENLANQAADIIVVDEVMNYDECAKLISLSSGGTIVILKTISASLITALETIINMAPTYIQDSLRGSISLVLEAAISQVMCKHSSGQSFIPAMEIYKSTVNMRQLIKENKLQQVYQIMGSSGREMGMINQEAHMKTMIKKGDITTEEAQIRTSRPDELKKMLASAF